MFEIRCSYHYVFVGQSHCATVFFTRVGTVGRKEYGEEKTTKMKTKARPKSKPLKTYLVTYHSPPAAMKKMMEAAPEEMEAGMAEWNKWAKKCGEQLIDMGAPLTSGTNLKAKGAATPSKRKITGYSIVHAPNMAGAKKLFKGHPHLSWTKGCEIEIHEAMPMG